MLSCQHFSLYLCIHAHVYTHIIVGENCPPFCSRPRTSRHCWAINCLRQMLIQIWQRWLLLPSLHSLQKIKHCNNQVSSLFLGAGLICVKATWSRFCDIASHCNIISSYSGQHAIKYQWTGFHTGIFSWEDEMYTCAKGTCGCHYTRYSFVDFHEILDLYKHQIQL